MLDFTESRSRVPRRAAHTRNLDFTRCTYKPKDHPLLYRREGTWAAQALLPCLSNMNTTIGHGTPRQLKPQEVTQLLRPGMRVFVQGLASESSLFRQALLENPDTARGVHFCGALVPGVNEFNYAELGPETELTNLFLMASYEQALALGRNHHLPLHYSAAYKWYQTQRFDLVVIQVSPPDAQNICSLGINADFAEAAMTNSMSVLAYVNPNMPRTTGASVRWSALNNFVYCTQALPDFPMLDSATDDVVSIIGKRISDFVMDGDCLQLGIGKIPAAVLKFLDSHRNLGLHSGLVTDSAVDLIKRGVINGANNTLNPGKIVTNALIGTQHLYSIAEDSIFSVQNVSYTHDALTLAKTPQLLSINSAVEIDLLGQVNSETVNGRAISSVGGAVDFIRGATLSHNGRAVIALPSMTARGHTRIVSRLSPGSAVSISRADAPIIVTEHGVADLRGCTADDRARRLIAIAAPSARDALQASLVLAPIQY